MLNTKTIISAIITCITLAPVFLFIIEPYRPNFELNYNTLELISDHDRLEELITISIKNNSSIQLNDINLEINNIKSINKVQFHSRSDIVKSQFKEKMDYNLDNRSLLLQGFDLPAKEQLDIQLYAVTYLFKIQDTISATSSNKERIHIYESKHVHGYKSIISSNFEVILILIVLLFILLHIIYRRDYDNHG